MLSELLSDVVDLAQKSAVPLVITKPGDPNSWLLLRPGLEALEFPRVTPDMRFGVRDLASFINAVERWKSDDSSVWIGENHVVAILNSSRLNRITLPLSATPMWQLLNSLTGYKFEQAELVRLLRVQMSDVAGTPELITAVRNVKFRTVEEINQNIERGSSSLGKNVERAVSSSGDLATTLMVSTTVFDLTLDDVPTMQLPFGVRVDVDVDLEKRKFLLTPIATDMRNALKFSLATLQRDLEEALECSVYQGDPTT